MKPTWFDNGDLDISLQCEFRCDIETFVQSAYSTQDRGILEQPPPSGLIYIAEETDCLLANIHGAPEVHPEECLRLIVRNTFDFTHNCVVNIVEHDINATEVDLRLGEASVISCDLLESSFTTSNWSEEYWAERSMRTSGLLRVATTLSPFLSNSSVMYLPNPDDDPVINQTLGDMLDIEWNQAHMRYCI